MARICNFCNDCTSVFDDGKLVAHICKGAIEYGSVKVLSDFELSIGCNDWEPITEVEEDFE